ncbi:HNH endonuclease [Bacillus inaquosorum]|uniref:HNH endonuclease signature motif containing protein n=1 Tax=Bacillus inaquosorum TaxID=483913 RepID=UPI00227FF76F|nr:hypothetical protein [Bacillus inaquosorum]MCY8028924.1 HNH endonuclease [Bacillus inaquosorum]MCY9028523.1 HNH endonuclease [Bacillus inaquosorum]MCY9079408.1 HNH endonuclease [Bacillus inaquosorum]
MVKKVRVEIPNDIVAKVLFLSDRTCCVCRSAKKPIQIHHIDENPANNHPDNLAVLCLDCHNDTMIKGGFGRKLNADQIILYRNDWLKTIKNRRESTELQGLQNQAMRSDSNFIDYVTSVSEIYRENEQFEFLAGLYDSVGNYELRDKYIEIALEVDPSDQAICYLRGMQGRPDLIPSEVIERETARYTENEDYSQRARFYLKLGMDIEAARDYVQSVLESLEKGNPFSAGYYLRELVEENLIDKLFEAALKKATEEEDLWWQIRALEELGWQSELSDLLFRNSNVIDESGDTMMKILLAKARGNDEEYLKLRKELAKGLRILKAGHQDGEVEEI